MEEQQVAKKDNFFIAWVCVQCLVWALPAFIMYWRQ